MNKPKQLHGIQGRMLERLKQLYFPPFYKHIRKQMKEEGKLPKLECTSLDCIQKPTLKGREKCYNCVLYETNKDTLLYWEEVIYQGHRKSSKN